MTHTFILISMMLNIQPGLLSAICFVESSHRPHVIHYVDGKGGQDSIGVCQLQLATARDISPKVTRQDLLDPAINIMIAGKYYKKLLNRYENNEEAIAAYNAGRVIRNKKGKLVNRNYVQKVLERLEYEQELLNTIKEDEDHGRF